MDPAVISLLILFATLVLFATSIVPTPITALMSALAMCLVGIITPTEFTSGFSNSVTIFCFGLGVVGSAMSETGSTMLLGKAIMSRVSLNERWTLVVLIAVASVFSMFLSNTSVVIIFMSISAAIAASSGGRIKKKNMFMAMGFASVAGGGCTLIGSTTQLGINAMLPDLGVDQLGMFCFMGPGLGVVGLLILYYATFGYNRQLKYFDFSDDESFIEPVPEPDGSESPSKFKTWFPLVVLVVCIVLTAADILNIAVIGIIGAVLVVLFKSISVKRMWETTDWNTLAVIAGGVGMAAGVQNSGACDLVASGLVSLIGDGAPPIMYFAMFVTLATVMTNVMPNISTAMVLTPIAISTANAMGLNTLPFIIGVIWGANMPFSTPIGASVITMTMQAGYRFKDYVLVGLPYNIAACIAVIVLTPIFYPLAP